MSAAWRGSLWSEAGQVRALLGWPSSADDALAPAECFALLRARRQRSEAAFFLAVALPRYEAVLWAERSVRDLVDRPDEAAMAAVIAWLDDPSEDRRRETEAVARGSRAQTPERLCAWAAFLAGGSVVAPDKPPHLAPRDAAGRFAAAAVIAAAAPRGDDAFDRALDAGVRMAETMEIAA